MKGTKREKRERERYVAKGPERDKIEIHESSWLVWINKSKQRRINVYPNCLAHYSIPAAYPQGSQLEKK